MASESRRLPPHLLQAGSGFPGRGVRAARARRPVVPAPRAATACGGRP